MSKTCSSLFCNNSKDPKYQYCYSCAKRKGLVGNGGSGVTWVIIILFLLWIFY